MSKIIRATQLPFGSSAGTAQMAQFGSFAAGAPLTYNGATVTPALIQALSNYLTGWKGAVVGNNSPMIEDMNSLCYLFSYQLGYLLQAGIPEWDSGTTYYEGSFVQVNGVIFQSLIDSNLNNPVTNASDWQKYGINAILSPTVQRFTSGSGTYNLSYVFSVASANATIGATYTNNSNTYTVSGTISSGTQLVATGGGAPTVSGTLTKTSGTGDSTITFFTYQSPTYIRVILSGSGGSGSGGGTSVGPGTGGSNGNTSTFGTYLTAGAGSGGGAYSGSAGPIGGGGGTNTINAGPLIISSVSGGGGQSGLTGGTSSGAAGGIGGSSALGNGGASGPWNGVGGTGSNGGGGGGGGCSSAAVNSFGGGGGGGGGYIDAIFIAPASSYAFSVGAGVSGGGGGTSGSAGGASNNGSITVLELYQ